MRYLAGVTTLRLDAEACSGCGRCVEVCPHGVFAVASQKAALLDADRCMECGACMRNCERGAIEVRPGVGCAMALVSAAVSGSRRCACGPT